MKKQLHKLREVLPEYTLSKALKLKNDAKKFGLWDYAGDARYAAVVDSMTIHCLSCLKLVVVRV